MTTISLIVGEWLAMFVLIASLNFIVGKVAVWSVGHIGFFGIGQLVVAVLVGRAECDMETAVLVSTACGALLASAFALTTLRLRSDFFIIASLALVMLVQGLTLGLLGPRGVSGLPRLLRPERDQLSNLLYLTFTLFPVALIVVLAIAGFSRSPLERAAAALRHSETLAESLGIRTRRIRLGVFVFGSTAAAATGALSASYLGSTDPATISLTRAILIFVMMVLGGVDSIRGSVLGSLVLVIVPRVLEHISRSPKASYYSGYLSQLIFALAMLVVIRFAPRGIMGARDVVTRLRGRASSGSPGGSAADAAGPNVKAPSAVIELQDVNVVVADTRVLRNVSFRVASGTVLGILGPNGAGKTTLLNVLSGFLRPTSGDYRLFERQVLPFNPGTVSRTGGGLARSFQTPYIIPGLSVIEHVLLGRRDPDEGVRGVLRALAALVGVQPRDGAWCDEAQRLLRRVDLAHMADAPAEQLSAGQRRRLDLGRTIFSGAALLLLDEPFANLDGPMGERLVQWLRELADGGKTLIVVEHRLPMLTAVADGLLMVDGGRVQAVPIEQVSSDP